MSAKVWNRRRQWKRLEAGMRYLFKHPDQMLRFDIDGEPFCLLGMEHPFVIYLGKWGHLNARAQA